MAITFVRGMELTTQLASALGLDGIPVQTITIQGDCRIRGASSVSVTIVPTADSVDRMASVLKKYRLVEVDEDGNPVAEPVA